jgi:manganese/zinc/iron transport system substrate-binding protein
MHCKFILLKGAPRGFIPTNSFGPFQVVVYKSCFVFVLLLLLSGCSPSGSPSAVEVWAEDNGKVKVLSTTGMIDAIVGEIGKDRINHIALITGEIDPHSYEMVKGDDEKLSMSQIVFYNGLGLEHGASLRYQLEHHANAIAVGNAVLKKNSQAILRADKEIDPHIWMDISLWTQIIDPIVDALVGVDPEAEGFYRENGKVLRQEMLKAHELVYQDLQAVSSEKRYLVTSHDAFNYFTRAYLATPDEVSSESWQKRFDAPEGLSPEGQLSAADIQKVIDHLIQYHIQIVFPESNVSRDSLKKVVHACAQSDLVVKISEDSLYGDAMGSKGSGADTYLEMIHHDANVLIEAWK